MPTDNEFAPYAPPANIIDLFKKQRQSSLPEVIDVKLLVRAGIAEGNASRVLQTLKFFNLIDEDGKQSDLFQRLRKATPDEYPNFLAELLKEHYKSIFEVVPDVATATEADLKNAFWQYEPQGQITRMITLFSGLCREAGLITTGPAPKVSSVRRIQKKQTPQGTEHRKDTAEKKHYEREEENKTKDETQFSNLGDVNTRQPQKYELLYVLLGQLPESGKWSQRRRDQWVQAINASINLLIEVEESDDQKESQ